MSHLLHLECMPHARTKLNACKFACKVGKCSNVVGGFSDNFLFFWKFRRAICKNIQISVQQNFGVICDDWRGKEVSADLILFTEFHVSFLMF